MDLRNFLLNAAASRSFGDWREVRPTWREIVWVVVFLVLVGFVAYIAFWSGIENHCLWDKFGAKCQSGG